MGLYICLHDNRYCYAGQWLEEWEEDPQIAELVTPKQWGNYCAPYHRHGVMVPIQPIRHLLVRVQRRGLDRETNFFGYLYTGSRGVEERVREEHRAYTSGDPQETDSPEGAAESSTAEYPRNRNSEGAAPAGEEGSTGGV